MLTVSRLAFIGLFAACAIASVLPTQFEDLQAREAEEDGGYYKYDLHSLSTVSFRADNAYAQATQELFAQQGSSSHVKGAALHASVKGAGVKGASLKGNNFKGAGTQGLVAPSNDYAITLQCGSCRNCIGNSQLANGDDITPGRCLKSILNNYQRDGAWVNTSALIYNRGAGAVGISGGFILDNARWGGYPNEGFQRSTYYCSNGASAVLQCNDCVSTYC
ncbi:unnamed protein product [Parajaminaea phylloscopi]